MKKCTFILIGILILTSLLLASCSQPSPSDTRAPASATTAGQPLKGGVLRYGLNQENSVIGNPVTQGYSSGPMILDITLESLLSLDKQSNPVPWLATSWKADDSAPSLTLTLKQGVKFHDNTDFNAAAAKWNLDQVIAAKKSELASVKSVDIVDSNTIKLNLSQPDGLLLSYLAGVRGQMISPTAYQNAGASDKDRSDWAELHPVGTGPFKLTSRERDVKSVFSRFDSYWQTGKPYLDRIDCTVFADETTQLAAFKKGDMDILQAYLPQNIKMLEDEGKYNIYKGDVGLCGALEGDSKHPDSPWAKLKVRQAAAYAVDNAQFSKTMGYGYWVPTNQFDVPGRAAYNPDVVGYPYNPAKAKELLAEAGYPKGFNTIIYGMQQYATMLGSLQAYLKDVGITAEAQIVTPAKRGEMFSGKGWDGVWLWECTVQPSTLVNMGRNFTASAAPTRLASVDIPKEYSDMVSKAMMTTDPTTQKPLVMQLQKDMVDKYAFVTFIYAQYQPVPMTRKVHDFAKDTSLHWNPGNIWLEK